MKREAHERVGHAIREVQELIVILSREAEQRSGAEKKEAKRLIKLAETIMGKLVYLWTV